MPDPVNDPKIQKRVKRHLLLAKLAARAAGVDLAIPPEGSTITGESVFAVRQALAGLRRAEPKGSDKRQLLQLATAPVLLAHKVLVGAAPTVPDAHRPGPMPRPAPTDSADRIRAAFTDGEDN